MKKIVLFLGSGFSAALGLPTTAQLSDKLLQPLEDDQAAWPHERFITATIRQFWESVFGWRPGMRPPALEDHFTQIDLAANSGHYLGITYNPKRLRAIRRMTIHRVLTLLKTQGGRGNSVDRLFKKLHETSEVTLITTNWDAEAESYLELLDIPFDYGVDETIPTRRRQVRRERMSVLKLHGCVNRGYCDCCRATIQFQELPETVTRLGLLLKEDDFLLFETGGRAAASLQQRREFGVLQTAYNTARTCLRCGIPLSLRIGTFISTHQRFTLPGTCSQLRSGFFVGYSLPEADIEIRHLLKSAQLARKDAGSLSIEVVLKQDCNAGERYKRFFGTAAGQVFQDGLEIWISERLEAYCR